MGIEISDMRTAAFGLLAALVVGSVVAESSVAMLEAEENGGSSMQGGFCGIKKDGCLPKFYRNKEKCICEICQGCKLGQTYRKTECGGTEKGECASCSTCDDDTYETAACNLSRDTTCTQCTQCGKGETEDRPCESQANRKCRHCKSCQGNEYVAQDCTPTQDTTCTACKACTDKQFETKACSPNNDPHADRQCEDCRVCGEGEYQVAACSSNTDTKCSKCDVCKDGEYESTQCTSEQNRVCSPYQYVVLGKTTAPGDQDLVKKTKDDMANVRCVDDVKAVSVCDDGCHKPEANDIPVCSKEFVPMKNGKSCYGACKPDDGVIERTLESAKAFCHSLGMRVPKTNADLETAKGTGCNYNDKPIWFDK